MRTDSADILDFFFCDGAQTRGAWSAEAASRRRRRRSSRARRRRCSRSRSSRSRSQSSSRSSAQRQRQHAAQQTRSSGQAESEAHLLAVDRGVLPLEIHRVEQHHDAERGEQVHAPRLRRRRGRGQSSFEERCSWRPKRARKRALLGQQQGRRLTSSSGENEGVSPPSLTIVRAALLRTARSATLRSRGCRAACEPLAARAAPTSQALHTKRLPGREQTAPSTTT